MRAVLLILVTAGYVTAQTFENKAIVVGTQKLTVEVADNNERRAQGLMNRKHLPNDRGMLFIFDQEETQTFWMKNTLIPLSIGFFDKNKTLIDIQDMTPEVMGAREPHLYQSRRPAMFALEVAQGWYKKNKIQLGTKFRFTSGSKTKPQ